MLIFEKIVFTIFFLFRKSNFKFFAKYISEEDKIMKKIFFIFLILSFILTISSCKEEEYIFNQGVNNESNVTMLIIDLKGAIKLPNIYTVKEGTILYELINLAGGLDVNADVSNINLAAVLTENQMITIPYKKVNNNSQTSDLVNINTATVEELCSLPGIGTSKANSIINYRMNNGFFITINDIKKVSGIGEELFNKIKEYICV